MIVDGPAAVGDDSHRGHDLEDTGANGDCHPVLTGPIVRFVSGTFAGDGEAVLDGDAIFVVGGARMALVADLDVAVE